MNSTIYKSSKTTIRRISNSNGQTIAIKYATNPMYNSYISDEYDLIKHFIGNRHIIGYSFDNLDRPVLLMEYLDEPVTLRHMMNAGLFRKLNYSDVLDLLELIINAYRSFGTGFVHGDIKPENIVFRNNQVLIIDFDCCNNDCSTPFYASPKILLGHKKTVSSDIYSLACVLEEVFMCSNFVVENSVLGLISEMKYSLIDNWDTLYSSFRRLKRSHSWKNIFNDIPVWRSSELTASWMSSEQTALWRNSESRELRRSSEQAALWRHSESRGLWRKSERIA